ncbi:MAG: mechanosensitive ion channel family protein [Janthinobacterium lividum]
MLCSASVHPQTTVALPVTQAAPASQSVTAAASAPTTTVVSNAVSAESLTSSSAATHAAADATETSAAKTGVETTHASSAPSLQQQIAKLPPITGTDIDVAKRSKQILAHLNAILRFYRNAVTPVQKSGEPSDVLYAEQSSAQATQIANLAFQAAKNEAALLSKVSNSGAKPPAANTAPSPAVDPPSAQGQTQAQRISVVQAQAQAQLSALQAQDAALTKQIATAKAAQRGTLIQQQQQIAGGLELQKAMVEALGRISSFSEAQNNTGLAGEIDRLQRSAPELLTTSTTKLPAPVVLQNLTSAAEAGVTTQASVLFDLLSTLRSIDQQTRSLDALIAQATDLRTPFVKVLRSTIAQGNALTQQAVNLSATPTTDAQDLVNTRKQFDTLTTTFQVLAGGTLPLSQEIVLLENTRGTLTTWRSAVNAEYKIVLRQLLFRVILIAVALGFLALVSNFWSRATVRYVGDLRRRRQLLFVRRAVIGFLTGLVLLFGFVTQFSSLATFAGFISAGIAVGLQTILLSVAAYFFIVGRYGVRVGDRITVAGVTGDVIEVGLVRFYMMELVGTGTELHSTGRVAVFANSVLFQTGTPIYKQMPGTEYAWHELTAKLKGDADVPATTAAISHMVSEVYAGYSAHIEGQHQQVESWVGTALPAPKIESRLQLVDGGLQYAVLFPVELNNAAATDQQIAEELVKSMRADGPLKAGVTELPVIKAAVKT